MESAQSVGWVERGVESIGDDPPEEVSGKAVEAVECASDKATLLACGCVEICVDVVSIWTVSRLTLQSVFDPDKRAARPVKDYPKLAMAISYAMSQWIFSKGPHKRPAEKFIPWHVDQSKCVLVDHVEISKSDTIVGDRRIDVLQCLLGQTYFTPEMLPSTVLSSPNCHEVLGERDARRPIRRQKPMREATASVAEPEPLHGLAEFGRHLGLLTLIPGVVLANGLLELDRALRRDPENRWKPELAYHLLQRVAAEHYSSGLRKGHVWLGRSSEGFVEGGGLAHPVAGKVRCPGRHFHPMGFRPASARPSGHAREGHASLLWPIMHYTMAARQAPPPPTPPQARRCPKCDPPTPSRRRSPNGPHHPSPASAPRSTVPTWPRP